MFSQALNLTLAAAAAAPLMLNSFSSPEITRFVNKDAIGATVSAAKLHLVSMEDVAPPTPVAVDVAPAAPVAQADADAPPAPVPSNVDSVIAPPVAPVSLQQPEFKAPAAPLQPIAPVQSFGPPAPERLPGGDSQLLAPRLPLTVIERRVIIEQRIAPRPAYIPYQPVSPVYHEVYEPVVHPLPYTYGPIVHSGCH